MSDEPTKTFTVTDRRHFTAEGDVRPAAEAPSAPAPPPSPPPAEDRAEPVPEASARETLAADEGGDDFDLPPVPTDLIGLIASLGTQAAYLLAAPAEKSTDPRLLEGVRSVITLLEVLKDKTEGRRTSDESEVLEDVLYQLRMGFVARSRVTGA